MSLHGRPHEALVPEQRSVCSSNDSTNLQHSDGQYSGGPQRIHSAGGDGASSAPSQNKQNADGFKPFGVLAIGLSLGLLGGACSDKGGGGADSSTGHDHGVREAAADGSGVRDGVREGGSDKKKVPAYWESFAGPTGAQALVGHTATLLASGRVLVAGGRAKIGSGAVTALAEAYLFDPSTNTFSSAGSMKAARGMHTATRLKDNRVLVVGGVSSSDTALDSTELFDPSKPTGSQWSAGPQMLGARSYHGAVLAGSDVLVFGGYGSSSALDSVARYDSAAGNWKTLLVTLPDQASAGTATLLKNGKVLIVGGYNGSKWLDTMAVYDPTAATMTKLTSKLKYARSLHTADRLGDGKVLIVGGNCGSSCTIASDELFDPQTNTLLTISHGTTPPFGHASAVLADGSLFVCGGEGSDLQRAMGFTGAGSSAGWALLGNMKEGRDSHTATTLSDGSVLVVGGQSGYMGEYGPYVTTAERYHP
jgi:hypothetical protein